MQLNYTITHNGETWSSTSPLSEINITNGSISSSITEATTRTLNCAGKYMPNNLVIGDKTLNCANKLMADNVVITSTSAAEIDPLCFTANIEGSSITINFDGDHELNLKCSTDKVNWSEYTIGTTITFNNAGDKIYFKGNNPYGWYNYGDPCFSMDGSIAASGNMMTVIDETGESLSLADIDNCFSFCFYGCSGLTSCPTLPATELSIGCYTMMFSDCPNLTTLPALPATTLPDYCYWGMFQNCSEIKLSDTQTGEYVNAYRIPVEGTGTAGEESTFTMFGNTGGTSQGGEINTTYYTSNTIV